MSEGAATERDVVFRLVVRAADNTQETLEDFGEKHLDAQTGMTRDSLRHARKRADDEIQEHQRIATSLRELAKTRDSVLRGVKSTGVSGISTGRPALSRRQQEPSPIRRPAESPAAPSTANPPRISARAATRPLDVTPEEPEIPRRRVLDPVDSMSQRDKDERIEREANIREAERAAKAKAKAAEKAAKEEQKQLERVAIAQRAAEDEAVALAASQSEGETKFSNLTAQQREKVIERVQKMEREHHAAGRRESARSVKEVVADLKTQDREADRQHKRHRQRQLSMARANRTTLRQGEADRRNTLARLTSDQQKYESATLTSNDQMIESFGSMTESAARVGRGIVALGLVGEKNIETVVQGLLKMQAGFDLVVGSVNLVVRASKGIRAFRAAVESAAAAQAASNAITALGTKASTSQTSALVAETAAAEAAAVAHGHLAASRSASSAAAVAGAGAAGTAAAGTALGGTAALGTAAAGGAAAVPLATRAMGLAVRGGPYALALAGLSAAGFSAFRMRKDAEEFGLGGGSRPGTFGATVGDTVAGNAPGIARTLAPAASLIDRSGLSRMLGLAPGVGLAPVLRAGGRMDEQELQERHRKVMEQHPVEVEKSKASEERKAKLVTVREETRERGTRDRELLRAIRDELAPPDRSGDRRLTMARDRLAEFESRPQPTLANPARDRQDDFRLISLRLDARSAESAAEMRLLMKDRSRHVEDMQRAEQELIRLQRNAAKAQHGSDEEREAAHQKLLDHQDKMIDMVREMGKVEFGILEARRKDREATEESLKEEIRLRRSMIETTKEDITEGVGRIGRMDPKERAAFFRAAEKAREAYTSPVDPKLRADQKRFDEGIAGTKERLAKLPTVDDKKVETRITEIKERIKERGGHITVGEESELNLLRGKQRAANRPEVVEERTKLSTDLRKMTFTKSRVDEVIAHQEDVGAREQARLGDIRRRRQAGEEISEDDNRFERNTESRNRRRAAAAITDQDAASFRGSGDTFLEDIARRRDISKGKEAIDKAGAGGSLFLDELKKLERDRSIESKLSVSLKESPKIDVKLDADEDDLVRKIMNQTTRLMSAREKSILEKVQREFGQQIDGVRREVREGIKQRNAIQQ